jgi:hypothetical protein
MKYKHIITGIEAIENPKNEDEVLINGARFPKDFVTKSSEWEIEREFLFTSEDGVRVKAGSSWWYITYPDLKGPFETKTLVYNGPSQNRKEVRRFSTLFAAQDYIIRNKVILSYNDVLACGASYKSLLDIVKARIKMGKN